MFFSLPSFNDINYIVLEKDVFQSKLIHLSCTRSHGVIGSTLDFESRNPSSDLGAVLIPILLKFRNVGASLSNEPVVSVATRLQSRYLIV